MAPAEEPDNVLDDGLDDRGWAAGAPAGDGDVEQQFGAVTGLGAETPAISEPRPSFCSVGASSLPLESIPCADWNFSTAATVFASHLPFGSPW